MDSSKRFVFRFALAALAATSPAWTLREPCGGAPAAQHLYVNGSRGIMRYALAGGLPSRTPDLIIRAVGRGVAVNGTGTVASGAGHRSSIDFFAPGRNRPFAHLDLPKRLHDCPNGSPSVIAYDANDYIYVGYSYVASNGCSASGVFVYAPGATGRAAPLFDMPAAFEPTGLAFDASGALYVAALYAVDVYAMPEKNPALLRTIVDDRSVGDVQGIAIAPKFTLMYAYNNAGVGPNAIVAYEGDRGGRQAPSFSMFANVADIASTGDVAYGDGYLYATYEGPAGSGVHVFKEPSFGLVTPVATLDVSPAIATQLALGP